MEVHLSKPEYCLAKGWMLTLRGARGARLFCAAGTVWLTQEADERDIVLAGGQDFTLDRDGEAIVFAFEPAVLRLVGAPATTLWARMQRLLRAVPRPYAARPAARGVTP